MPDIPGKPPLVIAHRGASAYLPEHSLPSKALAYGMGADYLEQDIVISRDGELLVLHDLILDHVSDVAAKFPGRQRADGHFYCIDFDLREIRTLRFTERVQTGYARIKVCRPLSPCGRQLPNRDIQRRNRICSRPESSERPQRRHFFGDKESCVASEQGVDLPSRVLAELADLSNLLERIPVFLACFDADELRKIHKKVDPDFTIIQLLSSKTVIDAVQLADIAAYAKGIGPSIQLIYQGKNSAGQPRLTDLVRQAHALGLGVYPYTFRADDLPDGMETFEELLELFIVRLEVDGLISDFTDRVVAFRQQQFAGGGS